MININKILLEESDSLLIQLIRYGVVGGTAFVVDFGLLYLFNEYLGVHYLLATAFGFMAGLIVNYFMSVKWVFNQRKVKDKSTEFIIFGVIGIIGLGLNELIMYIGVDKFAMAVMVAKIVSTAIVFIWNFVVRKFILFTK